MDFTVQQVSEATGIPRVTLYWQIANSRLECEAKHFGRTSMLLFTEQQVLQQFGEKVLNKLKEEEE